MLPWKDGFPTIGSSAILVLLTLMKKTALITGATSGIGRATATLEEVFEEIQRSNMSKLDAEGNPIYREDGKVMKSDQYFKPNIGEILKK